ncbi:putative 3'-5' exonuclease related to the exonuclease domain of PolB [Enhygromyxa salina]|uniref:Putative 3'-5' exonuclease related to the exonuclease domain of PolB n=1 Tax=Enhygromyxa salina TaxID=215803 RepID=A0A2S9Y1B2_9BACT|nr:ribonuclease H-like domain-containing protein [Enhygromyxa salina]PRP98801.1 putative 3'-5' exonuclease related to the exonuclease domain of PolB [Enhygromyxa salina]
MTAAPPHLERLADAHELGLGQTVTAYAAVRSLRHGHSRTGDGYYDLVVADASAKLPAKVWGDSRAYGELRRAQLSDGAVVKVLCTIGSFRDALQLTVNRVRALGEDDEWQPDAVFGVGWELVEGLRCKTLVFDIETVPGIELSEVPDAVVKSVARAAERNDGDEGKVMSLSPYYGKVVSLAFGDGDPETDADSEGDEGAVTTLVVPPPGREQDDYPAGVRPMTEAELLRSFWHLADAAELVVSFNGRGFDVPFLVTRSLILGVPARVDLVSSPFSLRPHLDLYRLLGHGRGGLGGSSLDVVCWALGIASPKGAMDGSMVAPTYARGDIEAIATYNAADVRATAAVYRHLREHLLPFRNDW